MTFIFSFSPEKKINHCFFPVDSCQQLGLRGIYFPVDDKGIREGTETFLERAENIDHFFDYIYPPIGSPHDKSQ